MTMHEEADRIIPAKPDMEEALLGAMMNSRGARQHGLDRLATDDFHVPRHQVLFAALAAVEASVGHVEALRLADATGQDQSVIRAIQAAAGGDWEHYAKKVGEAAVARRVIALGWSLREAGYVLDLEGASRILDHAAETLDAGPDMIEMPPEASELASRDYERSWLVRGLLERGDRLILTGPEGFGKSLWLRQLAVQFASGIHPVYRTQEPPLTVLQVDAENSEAQCSRSYEMLIPKAGARYTKQLFVQPRPQGLNLCSRADERWLEALMNAVRPDILILGPLYKLFRGTTERAKDSEEAAEQTAAVLDKLRTRYRCAVLIEAHSPHGDSDKRFNFRPAGSSLWRRWPEFGFGMNPVDREHCEVKNWRGFRERGRCWPSKLVYGQHWPWECPEATPPGFTDQEIF